MTMPCATGLLAPGPDLDRGICRRPVAFENRHFFTRERSMKLIIIGVVLCLVGVTALVCAAVRAIALTEREFEQKALEQARLERQRAQDSDSSIESRIELLAAITDSSPGDDRRSA